MQQDNHDDINNQKPIQLYCTENSFDEENR